MTLANRDYKWRMAQKYKAENGLGPDVMMGVCPVEFVAIGSHSRHVPSETPLAPSLSTGGCFSSRLFPYSFSIPIFSACPEEITKQILLFSFTHSTTAPPFVLAPSSHPAVFTARVVQKVLNKKYLHSSNVNGACVQKSGTSSGCDCKWGKVGTVWHLLSRILLGLELKAFDVDGCPLGCIRPLGRPAAEVLQSRFAVRSIFYSPSPYLSLSFLLLLSRSLSLSFLLLLLLLLLLLSLSLSLSISPSPSPPLSLSLSFLLLILIGSRHAFLAPAVLLFWS